jgi:integrase
MLARHAGVRGPWDLEHDDLVDWLGAQPWALETRRSVRSSLRGFYAWGVSTARVAASPAELLPSIPQKPPAPRPASEDAYTLALARADDRVRHMLRLAAEHGLRRGEVGRGHSRDVVRDLLGWSLRVRGKGDRLRIVPLTDDVADELRALPAGYAFPGNEHGHLSAWWVGRLVARLLPDGLTMHTLRHRFATQAYAGSRDLLAVQQLLGHSSPATTRLYVRVDDGARRSIVESVKVAA